MKGNLKKLVGVTLSVMLLVSGTMRAEAASSVTGSIEGTEISGRISTDSTSAVAVTAFGRSNSTISATATVYWWWGTRQGSDTASDSSSAGGVSAKAVKSMGGADVVGGKGDHFVAYGAYTWTNTTSVGTTY